MGEYATFRGEKVKIGTCENMYYLRYAQRTLVQALTGNVDPNGEDALSIRFRFPWPNEDHIEPGAFEDHNKSLAAFGVDVPEGVEHGSVQFTSHAGYLTSIPCPEGPGPHPVSVHRNGFSGKVHLYQQKLLADGRVVPVCKCGGCGCLWRLEEPEEIQKLAASFVEEGKRRKNDSWNDAGEKVGDVFYNEIARRILAGIGALAAV